VKSWYFKAALLALLGGMLGACPNPAYHGAVAYVQNPKYGLGTSHTCQNPEETLRVAEIIMPLILQEFEADGLIKDYSAAVKKLKGHLGVCQISVPEPCCQSKYSCAPPRQAGEGRWARKAGCTIGGLSVWVSRSWPPVCRPDWPDEPHCDALEPYNWELHLLHELCNAVLLTVVGIYDPEYKHAVWQPGGTEDRIKAKFKALRTAVP